jgi:hypothetical protein
VASPNANFLPNNQPDSVKVMLDLGRSIGSRGETALKVIIGTDGNIWTAYPEVEFRFTLSGERHPDPRLVKTRNRKALADIEGLLVISIDGNGLFEEPGVLLMELGLDLIVWVRDVKTGHTRNFEYLSMDYDEGPLLRFVRTVDQRWSLESPWIIPTENVSVDGEALMSAVEDYLRDLSTELRNRYQIEMIKYIV